MAGKRPRGTEMAKTEVGRNPRLTFSRRRKVLFQEAEKLGEISGAEVAIVTVSSTGKVYSFGNPSVDSVLNRYLAHIAQNPPQDGTKSTGPDGSKKPDDEIRSPLNSGEEKVDDSPVKEKFSGNENRANEFK